MEQAQVALIAKLKSENEQLRLQNDGLRLKEAVTFDQLANHHPTSDSSAPRGMVGGDSKLYHHPQQWHHHPSDESSKFSNNNGVKDHRGGGGPDGPSSSSPVNFQSFIVNSMHGGAPLRREAGGGGGSGGGANKLDFDEEDNNNRRGGVANVAAVVKHPQRLLGEIAFQLEQRILAYVFQGQVTFYGFTVLNVKEKIVQVATRPFTGMLDEGYQRHLLGRHQELMDKLVAKAGYNPSSHPMFAQFIINSYGRLGCGETGELGDQPEAVRKALAGVAPSYVLRDMLALLQALVYMAGKDGKPLFLW